MSEAKHDSRRLVALTGATGFIGSTLISRLSLEGYRVRALYRPRPGRQLPAGNHVEWIAGGIDSAASLDTLLDGASAVIHCAGAVRGASREDFDAVNVAGMQAVAEACLRAGGLRLLSLSSLAAREPQLSHYAASKREGERVLAQYSDSLAWIALRPPAVYGPGDREMLPLFQGMQRGWALIPGSGAGRLSLIYVDDLVAAMLAWLVSDSPQCGVYEVDDGQPDGYDWNTIIETVSQVCRRKRPIRRVRVPSALLKGIAAGNQAAARLFRYAPMLTPGKVGELTHSDWVCDSAPFRHISNWSPQVRFAAGLAKTLQLSPSHVSGNV
ncbi:3 beta-hydroxysteroid dehydrogenase/Delta 5--_4-isomerase [Carnimonas sp. R-84981]|uniref:NAD-dependent epimerase/dehydratase family protein n=1 Tax=Carnimonas bestiolae TaxID=3402172 RepID=UPI003EDBF152